MKYAIDRYTIGVETEVNADDFDNVSYIPQRSSRFFCPECNEKVFFRAKGGNHPNQFYHQEKTDRTPECDKRVDGRSNLTISQRVGLPVFITQISPGSFQLSIGFPALGIHTLEIAEKWDCTAKISSQQKYRTIKVNQINFLPDNTTLIPVDFTPLQEKNYSISINCRTSIPNLVNKWSDYADGFNSCGAIFSYSETGGRKIRRGDCISTNRYYYAITKKNICFPPKIEQSTIGKIVLNKTDYKVVRFLIDVSVDDKYNFKSIENYFRSNFNVWLLECQPELIPIWPPVVEQDYMIPVKSDSDVICAVLSGNKVPTVYSYSGNTVEKKEILTTKSNFNIVKLRVGQYPTILSVDRKYVGREVVFISKDLFRSKYAYDFSFTNANGEKIDFFKINENIISNGFILESNSKFDLYFGTSDMIYKHFTIRNKFTSISDIKGINKIFLIIGSNIYGNITLNKNKNILTETDIDSLSEEIIASAQGQLVPIPIWVNYLLRNLKNNNYNKLYYSIIKTSSNGKLHIKTIYQLHSWELYNKMIKTNRNNEKRK